MAFAGETFAVPIKGSEQSFMPTMKRSGSGSHGSNSNLQVFHEGDGVNFRMKTVDKSGNKKPISLWHDVTLVHIDPATNRPTPYLNFVCEIPKFSRKKYEIATDEVGNPIKQDEKKGVLREFKKGDIFFNYGCLPRTWEDPTFIHPDAEGCRGDNDPVDVCEIGLKVVKPGDVRPVKVLGILCMIDEGEADWKVVTIDAEDKWAPFLNDIDDVDRLLPGTLEAIREWFRTYKIPDGKPPNVFGLNERFMNKTYALEIIKECNHAWKELITGEKERKITHMEEGVKKLVRKLSKSNLLDFAHADDGDEAPSF
jgi:inorganic pyrophosphatase